MTGARLGTPKRGSGRGQLFLNRFWAGWVPPLGPIPEEGRGLNFVHGSEIFSETG
jgi:hypothetical protein